MNNEVLITGGTGLVGSAISQGIKLSSKDGDLKDWNQTLDIFNKYINIINETFSSNSVVCNGSSDSHSTF